MRSKDLSEGFGKPEVDRVLSTSIVANRFPTQGAVQEDVGTISRFFKLRSRDGRYKNIGVTKNTRICHL